VEEMWRDGRKGGKGEEGSWRGGRRSKEGKGLGDLEGAGKKIELRGSGKGERRRRRLAEADSSDVKTEFHIPVDLECSQIDDGQAVRSRRLERHLRSRPPRILHLVLAVVVVDLVGLAVHSVVRDLDVVVAEEFEGVVVGVGGCVEDGNGVVAVVGD